VDEVETIETHMVWGFLTDRFVYKMKKPIQLDAMDFRTRTARHGVWRMEVILNRRLAADVYRSVRLLCLKRDGRLHISATLASNDPTLGSTVVDWLVQMKRLPADRRLDRLLKRGEKVQATL